MKRTIYYSIGVVAMIGLLGSAVVGKLLGSGVLHPMVHPVTSESVLATGRILQSVGASREDLSVTAPDGALLRGWKVRPPNVNGSWVLLFHGVSDNRTGMIGQAAMLL
jgi:hypothetical protein